MSKVIFKIAGKKKTLTFTNELVALAFIKDASIKFGDKFSVLSRPDQCPYCGSLENVAHYNDGRRYDPFNDKGLWDKFKCKDCGNEWSFKFIESADEPMAPQQDADNNAPITSGISDINGGGPNFKGAGLGNNRDYKTNDRRVRMNLARHNELMEKYIKEGMSKLEASEKAFKEMNVKKDKKASREYVIQVGTDKYVDITPVRLTSFEEAHRFGENEDANSIAVRVKDDLANGEPVKVVPASSFAQDKKFSIYTGPTIVKQVAKRLAEAGILVSTIGTERVYVITDGGVDAILAVLPNWRAQDIQEVPRRKQDDAAFQSTMDKQGAGTLWQCLECYKGVPLKNGVSLKHFDRSGNRLCPGSDQTVEAPETFVQAESAQKKIEEKEGSMKQAGFGFAPQQIGSQVLVQFYPEIELISYPNANNSPMPADLSGDSHLVPSSNEGNTDFPPEEELLPGAIENAFNGLSIVSYVSTSPAGGMGIGRDGKTQVLEGAPLKKPNDIENGPVGEAFGEEFYSQYGGGIDGGSLSVISSKKVEKVASGDEKRQFSLFLKKVMGEVVATFLAAFKVTSRNPLNKVPGVGEIQLAQIEQPAPSAFNVVNTGSRVKYLMDKLNDGEVQECINDAYCQGAIWCESKDGGFLYECFARVETIDCDTMLAKYKFIVGTKEAE